MKPRADWRELARLVDRMADHTAVCSHAERSLDCKPMIMVGWDDFLRAVSIARQLVEEPKPKPKRQPAEWPNVAAGQGSLVGLRPTCPHLFALGKRCAVCGAGVKPKATRRTVAKAFKAGASREQIAADVGESVEWVEARIRGAFRKPKRKPAGRGGRKA